MKGVLNMKNNTNQEVIRIDSTEDVAKHFTFRESRGCYTFTDKDYSGTIEITKSGAEALGKNWERLFEGTKVSRVIANDTSNVTNMSHMFEISEATTLDLSNFDTSNVKDMSHMFSNSEVNTLNLSNFDTSKVIDMKRMFDYSRVNVLDLSNFDTSNVTDMSYMFCNSRAVELDLSSFDMSNVTDMKGMFCDSSAKKIFVRTENEAYKLQEITGPLDCEKTRWIIKNRKVISEDISDAEVIEKLIKIVLKHIDRGDSNNLDDERKILEYLYRMKNTQQQKK